MKDGDWGPAWAQVEFVSWRFGDSATWRSQEVRCAELVVSRVMILVADTQDADGCLKNVTDAGKEKDGFFAPAGTYVCVFLFLCSYYFPSPFLPSWS
jgi:hypothetical protein